MNISWLPAAVVEKKRHEADTDVQRFARYLVLVDEGAPFPVYRY